MFENRMVLVTGGAGVLGKSVAQWFEDHGARLGIIDYSEEIIDGAWPSRREGDVFVACDLTSREACADAVRVVTEAAGGIDVLCNIAGGFMMGDPVHETSEATWDFLFDLNARSIVNMAAAVVPLMLEAGGGKIVNVAARAAREGAALMGAYTASKAAVMRLTESMGLELRERNINVNCVMPSLIDTPRNRQDMPGADFTKWVSPDDIAKVIGFLASEDARCVHGAGIPVDGLS